MRAAERVEPRTLAPVAARRRSARVPVVAACCLLAAILAQTSGMLYLPPRWPRPDVVLVLALAWGFRRGRGEGVALALLGGLLLDLASVGPLGLHTLALGLAVFVVEAGGPAWAANWPRRLAATVLAALLVQVLILAVMGLRGWELDWSTGLLRLILLSVAADLAIVSLWYVVLGPLLGAGRQRPAAES
jgi:rod shape-determining protein MreD